VAPPIFYQMVHNDFEKASGWQRMAAKLLGPILDVLPAGGVSRYLSRLAFGPLRAQFGKGMHTLITGMAPIKPEVGQLFARMQLPICETYGMVEAGSLTFRHWNSRRFKSVGKPLPGVKISASDERELIVEREYPLSLGYFQCAPGEQERTYLGNGRIATGDIGDFDDEGYLYLKGRKKDLIVASNGYKVHPEAMENEVNACPGVACSVFFQRGDASHLSCVVAINDADPEEAKGRIRRYINAMESTRKVSPFVEVIFAETAFTVENGLLRPNMKLDRKQVVACYA
jgi:long-chain acyl-CoA synthetase